MTGRVDMSEGAVLRLDQKDLWNNPQFRERLVHSLRKDAFDDKAVAAVTQLFENNDTPDFDTFAAIAERDPEAARVAEHWRRTRQDNLSVYRPRSPLDHQMRFWPNNPKVLQSNWESYADIFDVDLFTKHHRFITPETPITSAGSCFAANISRQLQHWNYNYLLELGDPKEKFSDPNDYATDPARCGNIYNAVSMRMMIERAFGEWVPDKTLVSTKGLFLDPYRAARDVTSLAEYHDRWEEHNDALRRAMTKSEAFILTLGMTEIWRFADTHLSTATAPVKGDPTLFRYHNLTVEENVRELERIYELFQKHNPNCRIITTVSPVPLNATFNVDENVVVANAYSKGVLRIALDIFSKAHPETVIYFPSYEAVTMGTRNPWQIDQRHVSNEAVARVMQQFQRMLLVDQTPKDIVRVKEVDKMYTPRPQPIRRALRTHLVHPLKRMLGIEGQPFRDILKRRGHESD